MRLMPISIRSLYQLPDAPPPPKLPPPPENPPPLSLELLPPPDHEPPPLLPDRLPPPLRGGKLPRVLFATQATTRPPTFVLFTTGFLEAGYRRFLERRLREEFGFEGSPIRVNVRVRERRDRSRR